MKLKIGETIKKLRKEREITQEEFAEVLGVSCQSVSRWENNTCYPDMELIPTIAGFFAVSVDKLLGVDEEMEKKAVEEYLRCIRKLNCEETLEECIRLAREGVAEFPNNYILLNELMYVLFCSTEDVADCTENMKKYDGEIVALGERIMKYCPDVGIRTEATARLGFQHCNMGRKEIGRAIGEKLPSMEWCRERSIWWALEEEEKMTHTRAFVWEAYLQLTTAMERLMELCPAQEALEVLDKYEALIDLMYNHEPLFGVWATADDYSLRAKYLLALGRTEEAMAQLRTAAKAAVAADNRPEVEIRENVLLGKMTFTKENDEKLNPMENRNYFKNRWLTEDAYALAREREEFKEILKMLE